MAESSFEFNRFSPQIHYKKTLRANKPSYDLIADIDVQLMRKTIATSCAASVDNSAKSTALCSDYYFLIRSRGTDASNKVYAELFDIKHYTMTVLQ